MPVATLCAIVVLGGCSGSTRAATESGKVYVADTVNSAVTELLATGGSVPASPSIETLGSGFKFPFGVAVR